MILLPEKFSKVIDDPTWVNTCLINYWQTYRKYNIPCIEGRLLGMKEEYTHAMKYLPETEWYYGNGDLEQITKFRSHTRLDIGYGLPLINFNTKALRFELFSQGAYELKLARKMGKQVVKDHTFGTTEVGVTTFKVYKESEWDLDFMTNEYIPNTLYQYTITKLLKKEHQKIDEDDKNGVARGKHTIEEKNQLAHYKEVNIPIPLIAHRS
tara:strand:+ start:1274 stop:1903 length:630 start_codon:yes stop_codon:yes gene_type:complete